LWAGELRLGVIASPGDGELIFRSRPFPTGRRARRLRFLIPGPQNFMAGGLSGLRNRGTKPPVPDVGSLLSQGPLAEGELGRGRTRGGLRGGLRQVCAKFAEGQNGKTPAGPPISAGVKRVHEEDGSPKRVAGTSARIPGK